MATTRKTSTRTRRTSGTSRKADTSLTARTGRTIKRQPYVSAAIATSAIAAIAAAAAGAFFFRRSEKSFGEFTDDVGGRVKDGLAEASRTIRDKTSALFGSDELDQEDIAAEALTLKQTGRKTRRPVDDTIEQQMKTGSISY